MKRRARGVAHTGGQTEGSPGEEGVARGGACCPLTRIDQVVAWDSKESGKRGGARDLELGCRVENDCLGGGEWRGGDKLCM